MRIFYHIFPEKNIKIQRKVQNGLYSPHFFIILGQITLDLGTILRFNIMWRLAGRRFSAGIICLFPVKVLVDLRKMFKK